MLPWILWPCVGVGILILVFWSKIPTLWKSKLPTAVTTAIDTATNKGDQVGAWLALQTLMQLFGERNDTETVANLSPIGAKIWTWKRPETTATVTVVNAPSVVTATLDAATLNRIAALEAALAAKTTSTIPTASATG